MERKIIIRVHDLDYEETPKSVEECYNDTKNMLNNKGYFFDGMLFSIKSRIAYIWKHSKPSKQKSIKA